MVEELRNIIIFDYAKNNKRIDENFYKRIIETFSKRFKLEEYITKLEFENLSMPGSTAAYDNHKKEIIIDIDAMEEHIAKLLEMLPSDFNKAEVETFKYIESARIVFHELIHAVQTKDSDAERIEEVPEGKRRIIAGTDAFFSGNVIYSIQRHGDEPTYSRLKKWNEYIYNRYGYDVVRERDAEIQSYSLAHTILNGLENVFPHVKRYMNANVHQASTMGYEVNDMGEILSPLYLYAKVLRRNDMIAPYHVAWFDECLRKTTEASCKFVPKLSDRLKHGMQITPQEYLRIKEAHYKNVEEGYILCSYGPREEQGAQELQ